MATDGPPAPRPLWRDLARSAAVAVTLALLLRGSVVESFSIPSGSMVPTLEPGDRVFVSKLAYGVRLPFTGVALVELPGPRRGDVIVFHDPRDPSQALVKRVVGVAGDRVELREQVLWLNGVPQPRADLGELSYEEPGEGGGPPRADTCRRFRESLALGRVEPPPDQETDGVVTGSVIEVV
ncbi:MAG TPA: signal peptidase I, partial [Anaeromyxobacteraceae bacterium]|nr:signal peptidase I [Anaeromyxobacteraceae bacterium]